MPKKVTKKLTKKERVLLEQRLIGVIIIWANTRDIRDDVIDMGLSWRYFAHKKHRVIWRALETINLLSVEERMDIIECEAYAAHKIIDPKTVMNTENDPVRGEPDSAAAKQFFEKLMNESSNSLIWLERGLESFGALALAGGKKYLQELTEIGEAELSPAKDIAKQLFNYWYPG